MNRLWPVKLGDTRINSLNCVITRLLFRFVIVWMENLFGLMAPKDCLKTVEVVVGGAIHTDWVVWTGSGLNLTRVVQLEPMETETLQP